MDILNTIQSALGAEIKRRSYVNRNEFAWSQALTELNWQFTQKGLGDVIGSWVSTGKNLPVSGEQLQNVLAKTP